MVERKISTKNKNIVVLLLLVLILAISGFTFAYWAGNVKDAEIDVNGTVNLGTGKEVTTSVNVGDQSGQTLVPAGRADDSEEADAVESVTLTYAVTWTEDDTVAAAGAAGTLNVSVSNILIGGDAVVGTAYARVAYTTSYGITLGGDAVEVTVTVTLLEPENATEYFKVAGKTITFDINFSVVAA
ncbi:MAG: hypothetical protein PHX62_02495 [Bacilli bacterium]|nr:hypothetical protein [Bacilli bacterium]